MALILCKDCGNKISSKAKSCPNCGLSVPSKIGGGGWIILVIFTLMVYSCMHNFIEATNREDKKKREQAHQKTVYKQPISSQRTPPQQSALKKPEFNMSAVELMNAYTENEVRADQIYKNKIVAVTGAIDSIGKDIIDTPYVTLVTNSSFSVIQCMFDSSNEKRLATLSKSQVILVSGTISGQTFGNILLTDCSIHSQAPKETKSNNVKSDIVQWREQNGLVHYNGTRPTEREIKENINSNSIIKNGIKKYQASHGLD